MVNKAASPL